MKQEDISDTIDDLDASSAGTSISKTPRGRRRQGDNDVNSGKRSSAKRSKLTTNSGLDSSVISNEILPSDGEASKKSKSGRKKQVSLVNPNDIHTSETPAVPQKRGRGRPRKYPIDGTSTPATAKPVTKAGLSGVGNDFSYSDLFSTDEANTTGYTYQEEDEEEEEDENIDAGDEDSEYAPSDEEVANRISHRSRKRKGVAASTRRHSRNKEQGELEENGSTDEDEAGESETDYDDEEEEELLGEQSDLQLDSENAGVPLALFEDEVDPGKRDIYDFDAQSIVSDQRTRSMRRRLNPSSNVAPTQSARILNRTATASKLSRRPTSAPNTTWGSNIYSALAASLKTRADLDAYSAFLKSDVLNTGFDNFVADLCKPCNQHASLFYGASASLQSLMSRINDYDKVVELLHAFMARPYDEMQHRMVYLAPVIHQPVFGISHMTSATTGLNSLAESIDRDMIIRPAYVLDEDTNLLGMSASMASEFGATSSQHNTLTGIGNLGRYMPDIRQLIVTSDLYNKLTDMVALPLERVYNVALTRAHQRSDETDIDISPLEPPNLQRLVMILNGAGVLLGVAILDTWNRSDVPHNRHQPHLDLVRLAEKVNEANPYSNNVGENHTQTVEQQVKEVVDNMIDWVALRSDQPTGSCSVTTKSTHRQESTSLLGDIHFVDAFIVKPNGRRDTLLLVANYNYAHPPFKPAVFDENFRIYSVIDEGFFMLERHGFAVDLPLELEGLHSVDPEEVLEDKSVLIVPDLLYDTLRKVMLRELISSSGTVTTTAANAAPLYPTRGGESPVYGSAPITPMPLVNCTKFVIVDHHRHAPLVVAFDSPVRLALQVDLERLGLHPCGNEASEQFDQITPSELKRIESSFKPTTAEYRLVAINGMLFGLQIDDQRVIRRAIKILPARCDTVFPHTRSPSTSGQTVVATAESCPSNVRIVNDETNSSTVLPSFYYPHHDGQKLANVITAYCNQLSNVIFDLPIEISLYDVVLRLAQKHMPELLARQHIEAAEAAAYAEAAANPSAPPPNPVPLPEHWSVCCICSKELRSINGLLDHEMRHIGLSRFRCAIHNTSFMDRRSWQAHQLEFHSASGGTTAGISRSQTTLMAAAILARGSQVTTETPHSDDEEEDEDEDGVVTSVSATSIIPGSGLKAGLAQVFHITGAMADRMESPQCEKCGDYFLTADLLAQHLDFCDGVSFSVRTPISRVTSRKSGVTDIDVDEGVAGDGDLNKGTDLNGSSDAGKMLVCGLCGSQVSSRERLLRHFSNQHLQCILCPSRTLRSLEELSYHYFGHLQADAAAASHEQQGGNADQTHSAEYVNPELQGGDFAPPDNIVKYTGDLDNGPQSGIKPTDSSPATKLLLNKLMACDICANFCGTKYNYYFHQWAEHGVLHPAIGSIEGGVANVTQLRPTRQSRFSEQEQLYYSMSGIRRMKCKFCGFVVRATGKDYVIHLRVKHQVEVDPDVMCRICAEVYETQEELSVHLGDTHAATGEYTNAGIQTIHRCTHCEFWAFAKGMLRHSKESHGDATPAMYECPNCFERFTDKRTWRSHLEKHNEGYAHRCIECGRAFRLRQSLLHHVRTYHSEDQGPATCEYCGLTYPKKASLRYHVFRMHNQELQHECVMCQRRFRLDTELRRHVKEMHSGAVRCEICHKVCANLRCYAQHRQKHFRTRLYQCTDCQTTFKSKLAMKRHIRVEHLQLGPEKFECQICGKIVTQIGMHMLIHKEARFECEYCNKRFTKAAYYNEHLRIHRGEQPFQCHICNKRFNKKSNLNVHLRFHEKHRDEEGNYLELKPRGRISTMFGDALMTPADRAARQAAARAGQTISLYVPKADAAVGSDLPGAFNVGGLAGAAAEAAANAVGVPYMRDEFDVPTASDDHFAATLSAAFANDLPVHRLPMAKSKLSS